MSGKQAQAQTQAQALLAELLVMSKDAGASEADFLDWFAKAGALLDTQEVDQEEPTKAQASTHEVETVEYPRWHQCERARRRGQARDEEPLGTWFVRHPERPITRMVAGDLVTSTGKLRKSLVVEYPVANARKPKRTARRNVKRIAEHKAGKCTCSGDHKCPAVREGLLE